MSQKVNTDADEDMLPEYDFSAGVRGKHHASYKAGPNVVFLDPDSREGISRLSIGEPCA